MTADHFGSSTGALILKVFKNQELRNKVQRAVLYGMDWNHEYIWNYSEYCGVINTIISIQTGHRARMSETNLYNYY